jgi:transcriptional regulator with XRE-family HTH domain
MIGDMISKVRQEKGMTKTELAILAKINVGHLTHIEKGEEILATKH